MRIDYAGMSHISIDEIKQILKRKKISFKKFRDAHYGSTCAIIPKEEVIKMIPEPTEWVYLYDFNKFLYIYEKRGDREIENGF